VFARGSKCQKKVAWPPAESLVEVNMSWPFFPVIILFKYEMRGVGKETVIELQSGVVAIEDYLKFELIVSL
jgi:hypothetical protein